MPLLFAPGLPWPAAPLTGDLFIDVQVEGRLLTMLVGVSVDHAAEPLRSALVLRRFTLGFVVDPPSISLVINDEHILASAIIAGDGAIRRRLCRQLVSARERRILVAIVDGGIVTALFEKPSRAPYWRRLGRLLRNPRLDPMLEDAAGDLIWPPHRDARAVHGIDGSWRPIGWRP